ncbi:PBP1A family penicillin-binding protein [Brevibacillus sp. TJ4]|uniref:PBP1A family penicillin-binding protein n=1 Tax=Brevibacillus sp. TJ4 TaxID=3234853 RepID=UPI0037CD0469
MATKAKKKVRKKNSLLMIAVSFIVFLFLSVIGGYFSLLYAGERMIEENEDKLLDLKTEPTVIYDKNGKEIAKLIREKNREYKPISEMPQSLINAFIAVEDKRFYEHRGIDMIRIGGAIVNDIRKRSLAEGGSTITQQLARNVFLTLDQTFWRKTKEVSIAISLERKYSKDQILEMYLNRVYLGEGQFGVEDAARYYTGKSVSDPKFTVAEAAMLAAIPKSPTNYSPFNDPEGAKLRRDTIIRLMAEQGFITEEEKVAAQAEPLPVETEQHANRSTTSLKPGYRAFFDYMLYEAQSRYEVTEEELYRGGWVVHTTLDIKMQDAMVKNYADPANFPKDGAERKVESSMIVVDAKNGGIAAMNGGRNYVAKGFNYATQMQRQPGSTFKPLAVYAPAMDLDSKWRSNSRLSNERQSFNGYEPRNYDNKYSKTVTLSRALIDSMNVPAVWLLNEIGVNKSLEYLEKFGIDLTPEDRNLAIALGGLNKGTSPLKMAQAYTAFANGGVVSEAHAISKMVNTNTGVEHVYQLKQTEVLKPETAWEVHTILERAVREGTGSSARLAGRAVAGKTGTTQSIAGGNDVNKDAWFVGYTPEYVGAVWMGFDPEDKNHLMRQGSSMTAKLFAQVLGDGLEGVKPTSFVPPSGVRTNTPAEEEEPEESTPIKLAADLTMDDNKLKVVLSWIGGADDYTYNLYRISPDGDQRLIAGSLEDRVYVDILDSPIMYKYVVVPRTRDGKEGTPSNVTDIDTSTLENLLNEADQHHEDGYDADSPGYDGGGFGDLPVDGEGNGGQNSNPGQSSPNDPAGGAGEAPGRDSSGNPEEEFILPPDILSPGNGTNSSPGIELPPPPVPFQNGTNG